MAAGDSGVFDSFIEETFNDEAHDASADVFKLALVTSVTAPTVDTAEPHWNGVGATNFYTNEATPGGNYATHGVTLTGVAFTELGSGSFKMDWTDGDATWALHASNPTNGRYAIIYNETHADNACVGWIDLGSNIDMTAGALTINLDAAGFFTIAPV